MQVNRKPVIEGLYALTPDSQRSGPLDTAMLVQNTEQAIRGGMRVLQYRNKLGDAALKREQAQALRELTRQHGVVFIVNDDAVLAKSVDAEGVHLGRDDGDIAAARAVLGAHKIIGVSCYNEPARALAAQAAGADYVAFGAFYASSVKPEAAVASLDMLREARQKIALPIVAIGGITAENGSVLVEAGADALAVISAVYAAENVQHAARKVSEIFNIIK